MHYYVTTLPSKLIEELIANQRRRFMAHAPLLASNEESVYTTKTFLVLFMEFHFLLQIHLYTLATSHTAYIVLQHYIQTQV